MKKKKIEVALRVTEFIISLLELALSRPIFIVHVKQNLFRIPSLRHWELKASAQILQTKVTINQLEVFELDCGTLVSTANLDLVLRSF